MAAVQQVPHLQNAVCPAQVQHACRGTGQPERTLTDCTAHSKLLPLPRDDISTGVSQSELVCRLRPVMAANMPSTLQPAGSVYYTLSLQSYCGPCCALVQPCICKYSMHREAGCHLDVWGSSSLPCTVQQLAATGRGRRRGGPPATGPSSNHLC